MSKPKARLRGPFVPALAAGVLLAAATPGGTLLAAGDRDDPAVEELSRLSIEELLEIEVVSASKRSETWGETPAAVDVITSDQIARSGATSLPELLRLATGLQVARIDASQWAISARGFNSLYANKLLVMIDGRSVYNDLFSGVYWDSRELPLDDIERIEIIRGPGGAVWGANAVNGVINVITRDARETGSSAARITVSDETPAWLATVRWGHAIERGGLRVWGRGLDRGSVRSLAGDELDSGSRDVRGGFRLDRETRTGGQFMVSGTAFDGSRDDVVRQIAYAPPWSETFLHDSQFSGQSLSVRWQGPPAEGRGIRWTARGHFDRTSRSTGVYDDTVSMYELEVEGEHPAGTGNALAWGGGARFLATDLAATRTVWTVDPRQSFALWNAFVQDDWTLAGGRLVLTSGLKLEHNDFSGLESQPSLRLGWRVSSATFAWAAVSRAVRIPSRGEGRLNVDVAIVPQSPLPVLVRATQRGELDSEKLMAWEAGVRQRFGERLSLDATVFYHDYSDLLSLGPMPGGLDPRAPVPLAEVDYVWSNVASGKVWGAELAAHWRCRTHCAWDLSYTYLASRIGNPLQSQGGFVFFGQEDLSPRHQLGLRGRIELARKLDASLVVRWVDRLFSPLAASTPLYPVSTVPSYAEADVVLRWKPSEALELRLSGKDLLHDDHLEFVDFGFGSPPSRIPRRVQATAIVRF